MNRHKIRDIKQENFIHKVSTDTVRKKFSNYAELQNLVYEALVNYLSSRDYICTKPFDITKLTKPHKSIPVNPHLANAMYLAGYVERAGTGTEDIINKCREWGHLAPVWKDDGDFKVTIYRENLLKSSNPLMKNDGENDGEKNSAIKGLSDKEKIVFSVIKTDPYTTTAFLAKSKKLTRPTIERAIKKLKQLGLIKRIGPDKGGHWEVK